MSFQQQDFDFAIGRHKEFVRTGERRALRRSRDTPPSGENRVSYQKVVQWMRALSELAAGPVSFRHDTGA